MKLKSTASEEIRPLRQVVRLEQDYISGGKKKWTSPFELNSGPNSFKQNCIMKIE
jgi:hypothetical protein